jgi:hypothetical protein
VTVDNIAIPNGTSNVWTTVDLIASGGASPFTWSIVSASPGLQALVAGDTLSLRALTTGAYSVRVAVGDSLGGSNAGTLAYQVAGGAGAVPDGRFVAGTPLRIAKAAASQLALAWGVSCSAGDTDYEIYEGALRAFTSHVHISCSTGGLTSATIVPALGDRYYLVVPTNGGVEGSYGKNSSGIERLASGASCRPQAVQACP